MKNNTRYEVKLKGSDKVFYISTDKQDAYNYLDNFYLYQKTGHWRFEFYVKPQYFYKRKAPYIIER